MLVNFACIESALFFFQKKRGNPEVLAYMYYVDTVRGGEARGV